MELPQKQAVERVEDLGTHGFCSRIFFCPEKEWKVTSCNKSFSVESVHKETTFQVGDSQVSTTVDISQRLGCPHRSNRC